MADAFNLMRENDLIWFFVVNNYLLGRDPAPFDILYWNSDATRMPAAMHSYYLRNMYHRNALKNPGEINLAGVPIDLGKIEGIREGKIEGKLEGKLEGIREGIREGEVKGKRDTLLRLLTRAGIALTESESARIQACSDSATLDRWVDNVLGAKTAAEVLS